MRKAYIQMHLAIFLWGFTGIFGKAILMNEIMIVWYRMIISAVALLIIMFFAKQLVFPDRKTTFRIAAVGIIVCFHWVFFYASIKASNVSIALSCFSSVSLFTAFLEPVIHKQKIKWRDLFLGLVVMVGIYIIFSFQQWYAKGILFALFSAFLGSMFTVINKRLVAANSPSAVTFIELVSGFLFLSAILPLILKVFSYEFEIPRNGLISFTSNTNDWLWLVLLSVLCTAVAFTISLEALRKISAYTMNLSVNLEPLYSIVLAMIFFDEGKTLNSGFYIGTLIVMVAVFVHTIIEYRGRRSVIS